MLDQTNKQMESLNDENNSLVIANIILNGNYQLQSNQLSRAKTLLKELLKFHDVGDDGCPIPRDCWCKGYLSAVESAESFLRVTP